MDGKIIQVLEEIRDAVRGNSTRIDQTNSRLELTNERLASLEDCVIGMDLRLSTSIMQVATSLGDVTRLFSDRLDLRDRVERCEAAIDELRRRP